MEGFLEGTFTRPRDLTGLERKGHMPSNLKVPCLFKGVIFLSLVARLAVFLGKLIRAYLSSAHLRWGVYFSFPPVHVALPKPGVK